MRFRSTTLLLLTGLAACASGSTEPAGGGGPGPVAHTGLHVEGNRLVDSAGATVRLRGVDRSGTEYACAQGWGIFDGPSDSASIAAIASWHANAVRVPLNESCWLGINGPEPAYSGDAYRTAIEGFVERITGAGLYVILDLHWSAAGNALALGQAPMADRDHSPEFWRQVASTYRNNRMVLFDLFNEPWPDDNTDSPEAWRCWRDGGTCRGMTFTAAGMQELVDAVRSTGATNVILAGGIEYAAGLSGWLAHRPTDPVGNLAAGWHVYDGSWCNTLACWTQDAAPVAAQVPLILGELGEDDGGATFVNGLMDWMDARRGSYLAWSWDVWGQALDLVSNYDGTPTSYGQVFKTRFAR